MKLFKIFIHIYFILDLYKKSFKIVFSFKKLRENKERLKKITKIENNQH